ncbi:MAG TPA: AraC family transcriptional regulator, partial [Campylobacterales bacterium]|nr:AraC family transcriptional regulator [Campylobacterales bacterium]
AWNIKVYKQEYKGYLITFNEAFFLTGNKNLERQLCKLFDPLDVTPFLEFESAKMKETFPTMSILEDEYNKEDSDYFILRSLLESLVRYMAKLKFSNVEEMGINCQRLVTARQLIEKHYKKERSVDFYARKMQLSNKRLNEIVREVSGFTITQIIHHRLLLEAKREIVSQSKTVTVISDELGFENPSYFARFFKKHEGLSPSEFSKKLLD